LREVNIFWIMAAIIAAALVIYEISFNIGQVNDRHKAQAACHNLSKPYHSMIRENICYKLDAGDNWIRVKIIKENN
jgi:hypothetical protein